MKIKLDKPFASNGGADESDTRQIKKALNRLGYYRPYEKTGITGIPDRGVFTALKEFQKDRSLAAMGEIRPGDETVEALNAAAEKTLDGFYIWRTVGDDKVRSSHAALNGMVRSWSDSPDPGEDINCRCWVDLISDSDIEKEELPPPNIPGTNIPDKGIPEDGIDPDKKSGEKSIDPDMEIKPPLVDPYMPTTPSIPDLVFRWRR